MSTATEKPTRKPDAFASDQDVRWCPGCGDYSILAQLKRALAQTDQDPDKIVCVSGIGCSSRLPYYLDTYGIHSIHGRAPAIATGVKVARPDLQVWIATGDGDAFSIGGNHMLHVMRRNVDLKIVLFNNRIYGLTKGQISPTSELGKKTVSTPFGSINHPLMPTSFALGCEAPFVARTVDSIPKHMQQTLAKAARHRGIAFVEVYQNCNIFNDGAFNYATDRGIRDDHILELEHGKPMLFGKNRDKGIRLNGVHPEVVTLGENGISEADLLIHNERDPDPSLAFLLSRMSYPNFPEPIGVFRHVELPTYDGLLEEQINRITEAKGPGDLQAMLNGNENWVVS